MSAPPGTYVKYAGSTSAASCPAGSLSYGGAASCRATDAAVPDSALAGPYFQTSAGRGGAVDLGSSFSPGSAWSLDVGNASPDAADGNQTLLTLLDASLSGTDAGMFELIGFNAGDTFQIGDLWDHLEVRAKLGAPGFGPFSFQLNFLTDEGAGLGQAGHSFSFSFTGLFGQRGGGSVPEPSVPGLLLAAAAAWAWVRRGRRQGAAEANAAQ
ncbi:PEP-CTERM sorting domain-containing protein [Roseateles paludis]|uniref:PEP-CTERM sorting domain-containing protein n=1 Tax=Roseateles paludis TaxID=3145238 RepID=A0ABV0FZ23_9BURK